MKYVLLSNLHGNEVRHWTKRVSAGLDPQIRDFVQAGVHEVRDFVRVTCPRSTVGGQK